MRIPEQMYETPDERTLKGSDPTVLIKPVNQHCEVKQLLSVRLGANSLGK